MWPWVQCDAVSTCWLDTREPPHQGAFSPGWTSAACQGYSWASVSIPPTILVSLLAMPQLQFEFVVCVVVVVAVGLVVLAVEVGN